MNFIMIGLLLREAMDRLRVRLNICILLEKAILGHLNFVCLFVLRHNISHYHYSEIIVRCLFVIIGPCWTRVVLYSSRVGVNACPTVNKRVKVIVLEWRNAAALLDNNMQLWPGCCFLSW